jgi:outer membrane lipoprotein-sorting protein
MRELREMLGFVVSTLLVAAQPSPDKVLEGVKNTYRAAGNIEAHFRQVYVEKLRGKKREETGTIWATQDGRVRWSYQKPVRKDFVYDGANAYFYEPENAQVTVFERFQDSPLSNALRFLWGQGDLRAAFEVKPCTGKCDWGRKSDVVLELWPKDPIPTVDHSLLVVDTKTNRVRESIVFDHLKNRTEYHFIDVEFGVEVSDAKFAFEIPKGVSILRSTVEPASKE